MRLPLVIGFMPFSTSWSEAFWSRKRQHLLKHPARSLPPIVPVLELAEVLRKMLPAHADMGGQAVRAALLIWIVIILASSVVAAIAGELVLTKIEQESGTVEWRNVVTAEDTARRQIAVGRDMLSTAEGYEIELAKEMIERGEYLLKAVHDGSPHTEELMMLADEMEMSAEGMAWNY